MSILSIIICCILLAIPIGFLVTFFIIMESL